jgi:ribonuclease HI
MAAAVFVGRDWLDHFQRHSIFPRRTMPETACYLHFVLVSESNAAGEAGRWRFVLRSEDGLERLAAEDVEPDVRGERLDLLAVVRGLEALEQPSRVTLVTRSDYVRKGIRFGLTEWRKNGWQWEYFGEMVPVKNGDLWQRVDRAMRFHEVECRSMRVDAAHRVPNDQDEPQHSARRPHYLETRGEEPKARPPKERNTAKSKQVDPETVAAVEPRRTVPSPTPRRPLTLEGLLGGSLIRPMLAMAGFVEDLIAKITSPWRVAAARRFRGSSSTQGDWVN